MAIAVFTSFLQLTDNNGNLLAGGTATVYDAGTTTSRACFTDTGLSSGATNPIPINSAGRHTQGIIYISAAAYKVVLKDSGGSTIATYDNIDPGVPIGTGALGISNGGTGATTAPGALANLGGATAAEVADVAADVASLAGTLASTEKTHIATGTTAQRTSSPVEGDIRRNTTTSKFEGYNGTAWENEATYTTSSSAPTIQKFTSGTAQTYNTPTGAKLLRVRMVGGGGGGGAVATNAGANGTDSSFGTWTAVKGNGGANGATGTGGAGGTGGTDGTGTKIHRQNGGAGGGTAGSVIGVGPNGGGTYFAPGGSVQAGAGTGGAAVTNTGGGGGGASGGGSVASGGGGGGGEYVEFWVPSPSATYTYTVGAGGAGGSAGTQAGGAGAAGVIIVEEYYIG